MSGGHFNYIQYQIEDSASEVIKAIRDDHSQLTRQRFIDCADALEQAANMLQRVDWFISGDDSEETFNQRWELE